MLRENLTGKSKEASFRIAPGFTRQTCLAAGLLKELLARQPMFDGYLGEQKPALRTETDEQPVMPNFDGFRGDGLHR